MAIYCDNSFINAFKFNFAKLSPKIQVTYYRYVKIDKRQFSYILIIAAFVIGSLIGFFANGLDPNAFYYINSLSDLFFNLLLLTIVPLSVVTNITCIASLPMYVISWSCAVAVVYCILSTTVATTMATVIGIAYKPIIDCDAFAYILNNTEIKERKSTEITILQKLVDILRNIFPDNIIAATFSTTSFAIKRQNDTFLENLTRFPAFSDSILYNSTTDTANNRPNMAGLVLFSLLFGLSLNRLGEKGKMLVNLCEIIHDTLIHWLQSLIWIYPVAVLLKMIAALSMADNFRIKDSLNCLHNYVSVLLISFGVHFVMLNLSILIFTNKNPLKFIFNCLPHLMFALATSSSRITLPYILGHLTKGRTYVEEGVTRLLLPAAVPLHKNGAVIVMVTVYIVYQQTVFKQLPTGQTFANIFSAGMHSIVSSTAEGGTMQSIENSVIDMGLDKKTVLILTPLQWFLDRLETVINIFGNLVVAEVVSHVCRSRIAAQQLRTLMVSSALNVGQQNSTAEQIIEIRKSSCNKNKNAKITITNEKRLWTPQLKLKVPETEQISNSANKNGTICSAREITIAESQQ